jgi:hypothetical protein
LFGEPDLALNFTYNLLPSTSKRQAVTLLTRPTNMAPGIDMNDRNAWDDSFLINSWNDAQKEYQVRNLAPCTKSCY